MLAVALLATIAMGGNAPNGRPCSYHGAVTPRITLVNNSVVTLGGSGAIGGCPRPTGTTVATVMLTVCLQHLSTTGWVDVACKGPVTKGWSRYYRFARQLGLSVNATCKPGRWRTTARGGDGYPPTKWTSATVTFAGTDQYACGEPGGA